MASISVTTGSGTSTVTVSTSGRGPTGLAGASAWDDITGKPDFGDAALLDVGTTEGTVAAGDDERFANEAGELIFFLEDEADAVISGYKVMDNPLQAVAEASVTQGTVSDGALIQSWITNTGLPGVTFIPDGAWQFHLQAKKSVSGTRDTRIFNEIYKRDLAGTETLLGTTANSIALTSVQAALPVFSIYIPALSLLATDRIVTKTKIRLTGSGSIPSDVTVYYSGSTASRLTLPAQAVDVTTLVRTTDFGTVGNSLKNAETEAEAREAIGAASDAVGLLEHFDDSARWANGAAISHTVSTPIIGDAWRIAVTGTAPTIVSTNEGLTPANGDTLFYLGSSVNSKNGKMTLGVEVTPVATDAATTGTQDFGLNISFANTEMITAAGGIVPAGVVHIAFNSYGISDCSFYLTGISLTCLTRAASGGIHKWSNDVAPWPTGVRQRIVYEVDGDYLRITAVGKGSLLYYHADLSTKIGAEKTNFWIEPSGTVAPGALSFARKIAIHRVTDNPSDVRGPSWPPSSRPVVSQLIVDSPPAVLNPKVWIGSTWRSGGTPANTDRFAVSGAVKCTEGVFINPADSTAWYPVEAAYSMISTETSCASGTDQALAALAIFDLAWATVGKGCDVEIFGVTAANTNTKRIKLRNFAFGDIAGLGAGVVFDSGNFTDQSKPFSLKIKKQRLTSHGHAWFFEWQVGSGTPVLTHALNAGLGGSAASLSFLTTAGAAGDMKFYNARLKMHPF